MTINEISILREAQRRSASVADAAAGTLARKIFSAPGDQPGFLVVNPLGFSRRVVVDLDSRGPFANGAAGPERSLIARDALRPYLH